MTTFIIEGPDGSGKTSLARKINSAFPNSKILHFGAPASDKEAFEYYKVYASAIMKAASEGFDAIILDRSWYTDLVYGPVLRGRKEMEDVNVKMLESVVFASGGGLVIYCTADCKTLWKRCKARGEDLIKDFDMLCKISAGYNNVLRDVGLPLIRYDTSAGW